MTSTIQATNFQAGFIEVLKETFEKSAGIYLDPDNSIFETLAHITAEQASRPVSDTCASIAAHSAYHLGEIRQACCTVR